LAHWIGWPPSPQWTSVCDDQQQRGIGQTAMENWNRIWREENGEWIPAKENELMMIVNEEIKMKIG
jgi:hypothetical protein